MDTQIKNTIRQLTDLQDKTQQLDELLKNVRVKINNVPWDLVEAKRAKMNKDGKKDK